MGLFKKGVNDEFRSRDQFKTEDRNKAIDYGRDNGGKSKTSQANASAQLFRRPTSGLSKQDSRTAQDAENAAQPRFQRWTNGLVKRQSSRSPSPDARKERKVMISSKAVQAGKEYRRVIQHHPSLEEFKKPETTHVTISRESLISLLDVAENAGISQAVSSDATGWEILTKPIAEQGVIIGKSNDNSDYRNTLISMHALQPWKDFPTFKEIHRFTLESPKLRVLFHEIFLTNAITKPWHEDLYGDPGFSPPNEENSVSRNYYPFLANLNGLIRLACVGIETVPEARGLRKDSKWVFVAGGKCASKRRIGGNSGPPIPDLTSSWTNGNHDHLNAVPKQEGQPADVVSCRIVGDIKVASKFRYSLILPSVDRYGETTFSKEGAKVMNQIHDYMDMHHNRYGYIITQKELIMFRRRDTPPGTWGQVDYSPSIPISSTKRGDLNAMMVLWYFHVKYVVKDGGWRLDSCYENCPEELLGESTENKENKGKGGKKGKDRAN